MKWLILILVSACSTQVKHMTTPTQDSAVGEISFYCDDNLDGCRDVGYEFVDSKCEAIGFVQGKITFEGNISQGNMVYTYRNGMAPSGLAYYMKYVCVNI